MRNMRILSLPAMVLLMMLGSVSAALACDCLTGTPEESFKDADVVFEGELIRSTKLAASEMSWKTIAYTFAVSKSLKGPAEREITIVEGNSNCDYFFFPNTVYRVYARRSDNELISGTCFGNKVLESRKIRSFSGIQASSFPWRWYTKAIVIAGIGLVTLLIVGFLARGLRPQRTSDYSPPVPNVPPR